MSFFKKFKKKTRDLRSQAQRQAQPATSMGNKFDRMFGMRRRQAPGTFLNLETGLPFVRLPEITENIGNRPRRLPRVMPRRMPSRFFGGGLGSFFGRIFDQFEREDELRRLPFREDMPMERFPMMRPQFAAGDEVDMDMMMADQAAREGISPAEQRMMMIQKTAADMGRTISDRDAMLFGMGEISFEEAMSRAMPMVDMGQVAMERNMMQQEQLGFAEGDEVSSNVLGQFSEELPLTNYIMSLSNPEQSELLRSLIGVSGVAVGSIESIPMLIKRLVSTGSLKSPEAQAIIKESMDMQERKKMAEGGAVESEIDKGLQELQEVAPDAMVIQQVMTMVMEMIQSGASEEQIVAALKEMGLDEEDIQQVMMMVAEEMAGQDSIDGQLAQMM